MNYAMMVKSAKAPFEKVPYVLGELAPDHVRIRQHFVGLNFIDTYQHSGLYPITMPAILGQEAAGEVTAVGSAVKALQVGDRVAYRSLQGAYCLERDVPAEIVLKLPETLSLKSAAAGLLKGLTASYLLYDTYAVQSGDWVLIHAGAGGVGAILVQWAKHLGAIVIATAGGAEKCDYVQSLGADYVIDYTNVEVAEAVRTICPQGVNVVYDGVGEQTFMASLNSLRRRGIMVTYGNASGAVPPIAPLMLMQKGSLFLTRPNLADYIATREELEMVAERWFNAQAQGVQVIIDPKTYLLTEVAVAHQALKQRQTVGAIVLEV